MKIQTTFTIGRDDFLLGIESGFGEDEQVDMKISANYSPYEQGYGTGGIPWQSGGDIEDLEVIDFGSDISHHLKKETLTKIEEAIKRHYSWVIRAEEEKYMDHKNNRDCDMERDRL